jgi:hypothetical protein
MTPNKQVSPAIRILRGERDASARATHLEAATRKFLVTTNERKYMSTKTNFKRIALVAVAALGLGVLSSVPSQAAITGVVTVTATNGTATTALADSTTAGSVKVRWLATATTDSVGISAVRNSSPTGATTGLGINLYPSDTLTSVTAATLAVNTGATRTVAQSSGGDTAVVNAVAAGYASGTFLIQSGTAGDVAGTYTFTLTITPYASGAAETTKVVTQDVSIVVTVPASASTTAASTYSSSVIVSGTTVDSATATATSVSIAATAASTAGATVFVKLRNAAGTATQNVKDSLTVTIDKGNVGSSSSAALGKNVIIDYNTSGTAGGVPVYVYADGTTGTATVTIKTLNAGTFTQTLTWYGTTAKSIVAGGRLTVIAVGAETAGSSNAVRAQAFDAVGGSSLASSMALYAYSSDTAVISSYGTACGATAVSSSDGLWYTYCPLTAVKAGSVTITIRDAATVALSTVASNAVSVRVSEGVATSIKLTTDKATYAPGEKGYVIVTVLDAAGLGMPKQTSTTTLASGGVYTNGQLGASSDTMTATAFATDRSSSGATAPSSNDPIKYYLFYAPVQGGSLTFTAKGASTFSAASQTTGASATITVTDNAASALAAVTALATTVASLKTLITTLTNLVLKIQKKVKA